MAQSLKKQNTVQSRVKIWNDLKNAWRGYKAARMQNNKSKMIEYADEIKALQKNMGAKISEFPELNC